MFNRGPPIEFLVSQCRATGAYPINVNVQTETILRQAYDEIVQRYQSPEVNVRQYADQSGGQYKVIYSRFQTLVPYKGNTYNVFSQVTFPPNFPAVPPIFSVINSDENRFQVNKNYIDALLPDITYEVKLQSAANWRPHVSAFNACFVEFCSELSKNFPFFAASNPMKNYNIPASYDRRYNDPYAKRPFNLPGQGPSSNFGTFPSQGGMGSYQDQSFGNPSTPQGYFNTPQPFTPTGPFQPMPFTAQPIQQPFTAQPIQQPNFYGSSNQQFTQPIVPSTNSNSFNTGYQLPTKQGPTPTPEAFKAVVYKIKAELDSDSKAVFENADFLLKRKTELTELESKMGSAAQTLNEQIIKAKGQEQDLKLTVEKSKAVKNDKIENYLDFGTPKDEALLKISSDLKGNQETEIFLEDAFMEATNADLEGFLLKMNALWRRQFDKSLALKVI